MSDDAPALQHFSDVRIDGVRYVPADQKPMQEEAMQLLQRVHGRIWTEAFYDAMNDETAKYAAELWPDMKRLNEILGYKKLRHPRPLKPLDNPKEAPTHD